MLSWYAQRIVVLELVKFYAFKINVTGNVSLDSGIDFERNSKYIRPDTGSGAVDNNNVGESSPRSSSR